MIARVVALFVVAVALSGCHYKIRADTFEDDGHRGTRVTNPRVAPWAFFRGDAALTRTATLGEGDVLETECAYNACRRYPYLSVWAVDEGGAPRLLRPARPAHPDHTHRVALEEDVEFLMLAWTSEPIKVLPRIEVEKSASLGQVTPPQQGIVEDQDGEQIGVAQWGRVDRVR